MAGGKEFHPREWQKALEYTAEARRQQALGTWPSVFDCIEEMCKVPG